MSAISIIVPTLNEEKYIISLLESLKMQSLLNFEVLIIDGGSEDRTVEIARSYNAKVISLPGLNEFASRNIGANLAKGTLLVFTCADVIFPRFLLEKVKREFDQDGKLIALTGPDYLYDASILGKIEHVLYNIFRYILAKLPKPLKRFATSTNFLVIRKEYFEKCEGFDVNDINADGLMGRKLLEMGRVKFCFNVNIYVSARRFKNMGFLKVNKHYLYALENYLFFLSKSGFIKSLKLHSKMKHRELRSNFR
jgi:glycosyltransferase involved in cell wall biosynthesis